MEMRLWVYQLYYRTSRSNLMTRKDFRAIAQILKVSRADEATIALFTAWLASTNPRFDADRFTEASLYKTEGVL